LDMVHLAMVYPARLHIRVVHCVVIHTRTTLMLFVLVRHTTGWSDVKKTPNSVLTIEPSAGITTESAKRGSEGKNLQGLV